MSTNDNLTIHQLHLVGIDNLKRRSGWILALGIILIVLGMIAVATSVMFTLASMVFIGWLMIVSGILQTAHGFTNKEWGGFFIELLAGILYSVAGFMIIAHPAVVAITLTLMIAVMLIVGGIFRIAVALSVRFPNSPWLVLHGVVNLLLGFAIIQEWPASGLWVIGMFIGIDIIFSGWTMVMLGLAARRLQPPQ